MERERKKGVRCKLREKGVWRERKNREREREEKKRRDRNKSQGKTTYLDYWRTSIRERRGLCGKHLLIRKI